MPVQMTGRRGRRDSRGIRLANLWSGWQREYAPVCGAGSHRFESDATPQSFICGALAHLGERRTCNAEAVGAEPTGSTSFGPLTLMVSVLD